jgi:hypothetical protein
MTPAEMAKRLDAAYFEMLEKSCGCLCICNGEPRMKPRHPPDLCDLCRDCREAEDLKDAIKDLK